MADDLLEAWRTNHRINLLVIDRVEEAGLRVTLSKRGGRDVAGQLAHLHNVRVWHLEKRARDLAVGLAVFPPKTSPERSALRAAHEASSEAVTSFLADLEGGKPKRRGFRKGLFTTLAYLVAHEAHHRGSILLTLKTAGHPLDRETRDGIWAWDQL